MVDEQKISDYLQRRQLDGSLPEDVRQFADDMVRDGILTFFQSEQFLLGKWRGFTIGKFKLLERVGVGGMGQVFLCEHMFMRKRVAVKVLPPAKADQPAALGRFYREARAAGTLDHPNIVRTHDIDQDGNLHFIVMDYVSGPNLLDVVKKFGPMDLRRATSYVRQIALALEHAHRKHLIHRDIKPGNILIDRRGNARILDMGLARFLNDAADQLTMKYDDKVVLGTADYVAPEQVANSHAVDIRADIYALGATLYFLLAGHPPFPIGSVSQKLLWHRTKDPTPIRQIRPEIPDVLAVILSKMLAKDPKARYQTPAQIAAEMEQFLTEPVPLPAEAEMPVLSAAAVEGMDPETDVDPVEAVAVPATVSAAVGTLRRSTGSGTAVLVPPAVSPFGPVTESSWASPAPQATQTPSSPTTPSSSQPAPAPLSRPNAPPAPLLTKPLTSTRFSRENTYAGSQKKSLALAIVCGVVVVVLGLLFAFFSR